MPAEGPWRWFLTKCGYRAITMPWRSIYVLAPYLECPILRTHERVHVWQMDRDGTVRFCVLYLWYQIRYGYRGNPYEIEAYVIAGGGLPPTHQNPGAGTTL